MNSYLKSHTPRAGQDAQDDLVQQPHFKDEVIEVRNEVPVTLKVHEI